MQGGAGAEDIKSIYTLRDIQLYLMSHISLCFKQKEDKCQLPLLIILTVDVLNIFHIYYSYITDRLVHFALNVAIFKVCWC